MTEAEWLACGDPKQIRDAAALTDESPIINRRRFATRRKSGVASAPAMKASVLIVPNAVNLDSSPTTYLK